MFSFYSLPSSVLKHEKHTKLHAAYCYYYFANKTPVQQLISDALAPRQAAAGHGGRPLTPHDSSRRRSSSRRGTSLTSSTRSTSSTTTACSRQAPRPAPRTHTSLRPSLLLDLLPGEPRRPRHLCCPAAAAPRPPPPRPDSPLRRGAGAQVRHRRWAPAVLPVQLEVPHGRGQGDWPRPPLRLLPHAHAARSSGRFSTPAVAPALRPGCVRSAFASFATRALRQRGARSTPGGGRSSLSSWMCGPSSACRQRSLQHDLSRAMRLRRGVGDTHNSDWPHSSFSVLLLHRSADLQSDRSVPV